MTYLYPCATVNAGKFSLQLKNRVEATEMWFYRAAEISIDCTCEK